MTCKLSGLFSIGEDFEVEDLLETDWASCSVSGPADVAAAVSSCALRAFSVAHSEPEKICLQQTGERSAAPCNGTASESSTHTAATGQTVALGLRQLSSSSQLHSPLPPPPPPPPPMLNNSDPNRATQQSHGHAKGLLKPCVAQDDFDDWDVDLADLEEYDGQLGQLPQPPASRAPVVEPSAKKLRSSTCGGIQTLPERTMKELSAACKTSSSSGQNLAPFPPVQPPNPHPAFPLAPPQRSGVFPGFTATSPVPTSFSRTLEQKACSTPRPFPQARSLFETVSPAPSSSPSVSPLPLHTPVLTNRLVQLVSASNKLPKKRSRSEPHQPRTRRFPGPAGLLPQQPQGQNLDAIVISVPQTPAHGAVARLPSQGSSSQTEEEEFSGGAWVAMKAEMGFDERNPSCFLHTYSVVMVLRKLCVKGRLCEVVLSGSHFELLHMLVSAVCARHGRRVSGRMLAERVQAALKQLSRNKVPNMAVFLKSIVHTHTDARAVFKDPTGEMQGTIHRRLLEDRVEELKVGAVLLLKQVGVFSPSHRNHYLNVTSNNLLRIYPPDGVCLSSTQLPPLVLDPMLLSPAESPSVLREPVSCMQLMFDEEDDEGKDGERRAEGDPQAPAHSSPECAGNPASQDPGWDADDDLDELLGELPEDACSL